MAKKRLNKTHRDMLKRLARDKVESPETQKVIDRTLTKAQTIAFKEHQKQFPEDDMKLLQKYGVAKTTTDIPILFHCKDTGKSDHDSVTVEESFIHPENNSWRTDPKHKVQSKYDGPLHKACKAYSQAKKDHDEAITSKRRDYNTLIDNARTFEDVLEVWSEAEELRTSICGTTTALATINNDVIVRIKKDVEKRNKGAN